MNRQCKWLAVNKKTGKTGAILWTPAECKKWQKLYPKSKYKFKAIWLE